MANAGHFGRVDRGFVHISGSLRPIAALWKISGPDRIQGALGDLQVQVDGRTRAGARKFRAGGHDMYEKARAYLKNAKLAESLWY